MQRVVSLIASSTEMVCALGCEPRLVGRSHECDYPPSVRHLPVCTEPKFDIRLSSLAIDQRVKGILQEPLSVYRVDAEQLRALRPDIVVTQTQCDVCAVSQRDVEAALCTWFELPERADAPLQRSPTASTPGPRILSLTAESLDGVWADVQRVADGDVAAWPAFST